jgi:hypothetical protein
VSAQQLSSLVHPHSPAFKESTKEARAAESRAYTVECDERQAAMKSRRHLGYPHESKEPMAFIAIGFIA